MYVVTLLTSHTFQWFHRFRGFHCIVNLYVGGYMASSHDVHTFVDLS